ncbi:MAG: RloB family protein [Desulfuromonadaceae bacterium]|nr:RloB family protein [Desulfuromonadaceae bacterium]MDD5107728.1 RloB family protein [Desulfuromonadaceae bacterium]
MGSDDLFHKRKQRLAASLKRKKAKKAPYDRVLIVCEGAKTEPNYFREIRDVYRLNTANIDICGQECGSDPLSVVNYAIKKFREDTDYDRVYCVIDRDKHPTYDAAIDKLSQTRLGKDVIFKAITSVPCFEFWLLLHFGFTTRQFCAPGNASNCELVLAELNKKELIPGYCKGARNIFALTKERLSDAIRHANQLQQHNLATGANNPSTNIHELIEYLTSLNSSPS